VPPPAIRTARRRYLAAFLDLWRMHPRDVGRLYLSEFWALVEEIDRRRTQQQ
jgi:hypothetical protein